MISPNSLNYKESELTIEDLLIKEGEISLKGEIEENIFHIQGKIYNSRIHDVKLVIDACDVEDNFEIIHMGFFYSLPEGYELILGNNYNRDILLLYLKNDNNYYFYEFTLSEAAARDISEMNYVQYEQELMDIEHWWLKVYKPEIEEINSLEDANEIGDKNLNSRNYGKTVSKTQRIRYPENRYTYEIDIILELNARDLYRGRADGYAIIFIEDQRTYYDGRFVDDVEILGVTNSNIKLSLNSQSDDVFRELGWNTLTRYERPRINISFGWGYGIFNINYEGRSERESGYAIIPSSSSTQYKAMEVNNRTPIQKVSDSHQVSYEIDELYYYSGGHFIIADFEYDIFLINQYTVIDSDSYSLTAVYY